MKSIKNQKQLGIIAVLITQIIFGVSFLFTKQATADASVAELLCWRFLTAAVCLFLLVKIGVFQVNLRGKSVKSMLLLALFYPTMYFLCENEGIHLTSASESGCIMATPPVATMILAALVLREKHSKRRIFGIILTLIGVVVIVLTQREKPTFNGLGYFMLFLAVLANAAYAVIVRGMKEFSDIEKAYVMIYSGAIIFGTIAVIQACGRADIGRLLRLPFVNRGFLTAVLFLGIGSSVIAFTCSNIAISCLGSTAAMSFSGVSTIVSVLAGVLFLREPFAVQQIIGAVLVIAGVTVANQ